MTATPIRFLTFTLTLAPLLALSLTAVPAPAAHADSLTDDSESSLLFVETQPMALAFRGASLGVQYQRGHWRAGGGGYFFSYPDFFVNQMSGNADEGWGVRVRPAVWVEGNYALREDGSGFSFGANVLLARLAITNSNVAGETSYQSLVVVPKVSYTFVVADHLSIMPYLGVELRNKVAGETQLGDMEFEPASFLPLLGLSVGVVF